METKICSKCKEPKPFSEYYKRSDRKIGIQPRCKSCCDEATENNPKRVEYLLAYNAEPINRDRRKRLQRERRARMPLEERSAMYRADTERSKRVDIKRHKIRIMMGLARKRAKETGLECECRLNDADNLFPGWREFEYCPVFPWIKIEWDNPQQLPSSPTIGRLDHSKGYVKGNMILMSWRANDCLGDATDEEHDMMTKWRKRLKGTEPFARAA